MQRRAAKKQKARWNALDQNNKRHDDRQTHKTINIERTWEYAMQQQQEERWKSLHQNKLNDERWMVQARNKLETQTHNKHCNHQRQPKTKTIHILNMEQAN